MKSIQHIDTSIISRPPKTAFGPMYSMHRYWSKKSPDVVAAYIKSYTDEGDIILDPFCGSGIIACEAVRLRRRAIAIDLNPMAAFITRMTLTPVNLSRLKWAFDDIRKLCESRVSQLYTTTCVLCGKDVPSEFAVRDNDDVSLIGYRCNCLKRRQFKSPDGKDLSIIQMSEEAAVPHWFPDGVKLPQFRKCERFEFLHELFSNRNLIGLSIILNAINVIEDKKVREFMKFAFTAALDKCSRLKPVAKAEGSSLATLREAWVAVRFYAPRKWQEVNPWHAFCRSFHRVYAGKKDSNSRLKDAVLGDTYDDLLSGRANVLLLSGSAEKCLSTAPKSSVDYVITDPPFGEHIQFLSLSTLWGGWLQFEFDYDQELIVNRYKDKSISNYRSKLGEILRSMTHALKPDAYVHIFSDDVQELHSYLRSITEADMIPERVVYQPPAGSFGTWVKNKNKHVGSKSGTGASGSYIMRVAANSTKPSFTAQLPSEAVLKDRISQIVEEALSIRDKQARIKTLVHAVYQRLSTQEILWLARRSSEGFIEETIRRVAEGRTERTIRYVNEPKTNKSDIMTRVRLALLDAKSLSADQQNQAYQRVLNRFAQNGITVDDINDLAERDLTADVGSHRRKRIATLLMEFGTILGYRSELSTERPGKVIWSPKEKEKWASFEINKDILVKGYLNINGTTVDAPVGTMTAEGLERALNDWCANHPVEGRQLADILNPMDQIELPTPGPRQIALKVLDNREVCSDHYLITLKIPKGLNFEPQPGQFLHVVCDPQGVNGRAIGGDAWPCGDNEDSTSVWQEGKYELAVRRPFSVHGVIYQGFDRRLLITPTIIPPEMKNYLRRTVTEIDILYKVVGEGTRLLSRVTKGAKLDVIGPIGKGFVTENVRTAIIVAGGIGVAPLVALAEKLRYLGTDVHLYFGVMRTELVRLLCSRRADSTVELGFANGTPGFFNFIERDIAAIGAKVRLCTEPRLVTEELEIHIREGFLPLDGAMVYACGPSGMLKKVAGIASKNNVPCQVLLEERMACGIGACLSCVCQVQGRQGIEKKRVCVDGPVFNARDIIWDG